MAITEELYENSVFELVDKMSIICSNGNPKPITLTFYTEEFEKDLEGSSIPTKCNIRIDGNIATDEDRAVARIFRSIYGKMHRFHKLPHSRKKWIATHHDIIVLLMNVYDKWHEDYHLVLKIKSVDVKGSRDNYMRICQYFNLIPKEETQNG